MGFLTFFFLTHWWWRAMLLLLLSSQFHMSGGKVTVTHVLQRYFESVPSDKVISCAVFVVVHLFPLFKILICRFCLHGSSKTTQTSPSKASDVFLLLSLNLASFWEVGACRNGSTWACCTTLRDSCAELSMEFSWREMLLKKQSEQSLYSQWGLAVSGRIPGCKYSSSEDLISCYVLMWLQEWFWKGRRLQQGFASSSDFF